MGCQLLVSRLKEWDVTSVLSSIPYPVSLEFPQYLISTFGGIIVSPKTWQNICGKFAIQCLTNHTSDFPEDIYVLKKWKEMSSLTHEEVWYVSGGNSHISQVSRISSRYVELVQKNDLSRPTCFGIMVTVTNHIL